MTDAAIWRDRARLGRYLTAWRGTVGDRQLFRVVSGPGWLRLHLAGDDRPGLMLTMLPGAVLVVPFDSPLPRPLHDALTPTAGDPLVELLRGGTLTGAALHADDLVLELVIATDAGPRRVRQQLFGSRGNLAVLAADHRVLYTAHGRPHPCLVAAEPALAAPPTTDLPDAGDLAAWADAGLYQLTRQREITLAEAMARTAGRVADQSARLVDNLTADLARADGGETRRREAETLAVHLHTIERGQESVTLADPRDGTEHTISLDPALKPHANLERLFKLARKGERGRELIAERLDHARTEAQVAAARRDALAPLVAGPATLDHDTLDAAIDRLVALQEFRRAHGEVLSARATTGVQAPEEPTRPFRRYRIDGRWHVWIGRSSEENDELTHRASHPRDLWLHAQGVPGSHVVLRTDGRPDQVPRHVLERAAALAALHSKARHSALVPVIYTERRYVRKPRRAPAGTAVCLQEDNLFAEPGVAAGVEPA